ncbi:MULTISPECIES: hypothetical protein [unclassified Kaistella]|uniref:hypothetical protein n=1 Tax=unclassified Kaistella TaxID=2762626 RepID=UPI002732ABAD|nr:MULTISPECIES: hypothetical protein [unclassified Kaistella]MDP2454272.1 hypothetical protein [Kaistella sp. SH11-4b]MDP2457657.1 hypothetical protein [Kaistella sp. SH40-3]MDP2460415.1 hypothetical protein [Kaistella sp. SH19-2b]
MDKKNELSDWSDKKLIKQRDLLKGVLIGMYVVCFLSIVALLYIFFFKEFAKLSIGSFIPVFLLPVITLPLLSQVNSLNKEIKSRNLKKISPIIFSFLKLSN